MREITIKSIGIDCYEVTSKKKNRIDQYIVDLRTHYCTCKGWFYSKFPKTCTHIKSTIQLLRNGGHCIKWNKKEQSHYGFGKGGVCVLVPNRTSYTEDLTPNNKSA